MLTAVKHPLVNRFIGIQGSPECEKETKEMSKIFGFRASNLVRELEGAVERAFGAALQFVANRPMVGPDHVLVPFAGRVHQHHRPLEVVHQYLVRLLGDLTQQPLEEPLGLVGVAARLQKDKRFPQFDVARPIDVVLAYHHQAGKDQQDEKEDKKPILPQKTHHYRYVRHKLYWEACRNQQITKFV